MFYLHNVIYTCVYYQPQVSLRPSMASLKLGSSSRSKLSSQDSSDSTGALEGTEPVVEKGRDNVKMEPVRPALPRTRDDSSDEDEQPILTNNGV